MPFRSIAFLIYFCGSTAGTLLWPMVGVICYLVLYHVYPQTTWWGKAIEHLGIRYAFICGSCLLIGTFLNLPRQPFGRRFVHPLEWCVLLFFLAMLISTATGTKWDYRSEVFLDKMAKVVLFTFVFSHVVVTADRLWHITLLLMLMSLYLGHEADNAPPGAFERNRLNGIGGPDFRESAGLAIHLVALLPFIAIVFRQKMLILKLMAFLATGYSINAILLCRARSAFLAGMITGVIAIWLIPRRYRTGMIVLLICGAVGGVILSDSWFWDRMMTIFTSAESRDESASTRITIWSAAWEMIKANPQGVGIGHFEVEIGKYAGPGVQHRDAHNTFVLCAAEVGFPGLLAFVATLATAWGTLGHLNRRVRREMGSHDLFELLIFANRLALLVYVISGMFVSRLYTEGFWVLAMLPVCLSRAVENALRSECRQPVPILAPELGRLRPGAWPVPA